MQSWAEAFGAVGTVAAFGVASAVYWLQQRDRRADESNQARLVYSVVDGDATHTRVEVQNDSESPIFRLRLGVWHNCNGGLPEHSLGDMQAILSPHTHVELWRIRTQVVTDRYGGVDSIRYPEQVIRHQIRFVDAHGREWLREGDADPQRVTGPGRITRLLSSVRQLGRWRPSVPRSLRRRRR